LAKATARLIRQWPGLGVLMAVAEFECGIIKERVIAGLAAAQATVYQGMMIIRWVTFMGRIYATQWKSDNRKKQDSPSTESNDGVRTARPGCTGGLDRTATLVVEPAIEPAHLLLSGGLLTWRLDWSCRGSLC